MKHHIHIGTLTENTEMETALHRWLHTIQHFSRREFTDGDLFFGQRRHPRACTGNQHFIPYTPGDITATANSKSGIAYTMSLGYKLFYLFIRYHNDYNAFL